MDHTSAQPAPFDAVPTNVPLVLLPVRLETRIETASPTLTLLVRVFPDDVHADSHDARLTADEVVWGRHFWTQVWRAGGDAAQQRATWQQLVQQFGAPRAKYIAERLRPINQQDTPAMAVPPGLSLDTEPRWPEIEPRPAGWSRGALTRVLPNRWIAIAYAAGQRLVQVGAPIPEELSLGPALEGATGDLHPERLADDPHLGWLVDFATAERVGMAVRIATSLPRDTRVDRVLVFGAGASTVDVGAERLEQLLRAHHYSSGLGFVPQGTPTNNTADVPSGFSSLETGYTGGPLADAAAREVVANAGSNAETTARALGVDVTLLASVEHGGREEQRDAFHMNNALWQATWGYYLEMLLAGEGSPFPAASPGAREHFASLVRARGPLPVLRVGAQPYGVLPIVSLDRWGHAGDEVSDAVVRVARVLRDVWRRALRQVPVIGDVSDAQALLGVLPRTPVSTSFGARDVQPIVALGPIAGSPRVGSEALRQLARSVGIEWLPRQLRSLVAPWQTRRDLPLAAVRRPAAGEPPPPNLLEWTVDAAWRQVRNPPDAFRPASILELLVRHAALREQADAALRVLLRRGLASPNARNEIETAGTAGPTPWSLLGTVVPDLDGVEVGVHLDRIRAEIKRRPSADEVRAGAIWQRHRPIIDADAHRVDDDLTALASFTESLAYLARRPPDLLARLVGETLDLCSHRLDAWLTSLATRRLEALRSRVPRGVVIGGYGWLEDISLTARTPVDAPDDTLPSDPAPPLYVSDRNEGYVHTPSLGHATTAAILRSGYVSRQHANDREALAVNLSSRRVRTARWLLDGIRAGQSLGALLGYRFERGLHENHPRTLVLERYIERFRALAPLRPAPASAMAQESVAVRLVVDGLALLHRYRAGRNAGGAPRWDTETIPFGELNASLGAPLPPDDPAEPRFSAIIAELDALDDAVDAIGDVTLTEGVHQMAQGNAERARAALEAIASGDAPPPELTVLDTPRTGIAVTHRLLIFCERDAAAAWGATTPRSVAEPRLNAWAANLLGPSAVAAHCRAEYLDGETGAPIPDAEGLPTSHVFSLNQLELSPLDIVYAQGLDGDPSLSEIGQRLSDLALRHAPAHVPETATVRLLVDREDAWPVDVMSVAELVEVARALQRLLSSSRALAADDVSWAAADQDVPAGSAAPAATAQDSDSDLNELAARAVSAAASFRETVAAVLTAADDAAVDLDAMRHELRRSLLFGVSGAVPLSSNGSDAGGRTALRVQIVSVARELRERRRKLDDLEQTLARGRRPDAGYHRERLATIFGDAFRVLDVVPAEEPDPLHETLLASVDLQGGNALEAVQWTQRAARVREGVARFYTAMTYGEAIGGVPLQLTVGQLPYAPGDRWAALVPQGDRGVLGGRLSLVVQSATPIDVREGLCGLVVDEWVELVPSPSEMTGLAFHYDRPNARAPQSILLAVAPDDRLSWDVETLEATLLETLEMARLRLVDQLDLRELDEVLPVVHLAQPGVDETITAPVTNADPPVQA